MSLTREQICQTTSQKLAVAVATCKSIKATIGLDGFVDEIIAVVDKRQDSTNYQPVKTIAAMASKIAGAAGQSSNYELVVKQRKLGGNGPIMANALACAGFDVTYIGNLGYPKIDPVFEEFANRARVITIADPGHTDALEFEDGKLMFGKHQTLRDVNWDNLITRVGKAKLQQLCNDSKLIAMVNWTMLPFMTSIWESLLKEILSTNTSGPRRKFFADLADPEKRTKQDIIDAMSLLSRYQSQMDVILGLNLKESGQIAEVLGIPAPIDAEKGIEQTACAIREKMQISCVVVHPRKGAAAATAEYSASFAGPFVGQPRISTGAGDHFNAGFCLGQVLGLSLEESLCCGCGTSGYYVRSAESPSAQQLSEFVAKLPLPQA
ncbi:MAG TPA: PfkB family carbohydrate kinase [Tepidisphaeraceae bacterium]|nr:PfkB family carbohydrate kinase [Tepidisphaeraceae bacterium]